MALRCGALLLTLLGLLARCSAAEETVVRGKTVLLTRDDPGLPPRRGMAVFTNGGKGRTHVRVPDPSLLVGVRTGMHVEARGAWLSERPPPGGARRLRVEAESALCVLASGVKVTSTGSARFGVPRSAPVAGYDGEAAAMGAGQPAEVINPLVADQVSTLFIPITLADAEGKACPGTQLPTVSAEAVRDMVFKNISTTLSQCSYGKSQMTPGNTRIAPVTVGCSGTSYGVPWSSATCIFDDFGGWADAAEAELAGQGVDLSKYAFKVFLLPPSPCSFIGVGYVGCNAEFPCRAWVSANYWLNPAAILHEMGHNMYLMHAAAQVEGGALDEYLDRSSIMGGCCEMRCPNTPHAWQLGWLPVQELDGTSLKPGQTRSIRLLAQSSAGARGARSGPNVAGGVRIKPTWVAGADPIFVGFRTRGGGDRGLPSSYVNRVHVYTSPVANTFDSRISMWRAGLVAGKAWQHPTAGIVTRVRSVSGDVASIQICRVAGQETLASCTKKRDFDCNGLVGIDDPACKVLLRRAGLA